MLAPGIDRQQVLNVLKQHEIYAVFHYVPLHSSPAGERYGRTHGNMQVTEHSCERLLRLPLWWGLPTSDQDRVVQVLGQTLSSF
ncbi:dTDP-4-amino-4,6-dideoxygalactose transaminase [compost metagenome]